MRPASAADDPRGAARLKTQEQQGVFPIRSRVVYPVIAIGLAVLVTARARTPVDALWLGAVFGATSYAIYDLTNHATLREWRTAMTLVDICWGAFSCAVASWAAASFARV